MDGLFIWAIICIILVIIVGAIGFYDLNYIRPIANDKANNHCKVIGFDQVKTFDRIGFLSKNSVAIRCEYAERYTDLGVRTNS